MSDKPKVVWFSILPFHLAFGINPEIRAGAGVGDMIQYTPSILELGKLRQNFNLGTQERKKFKCNRKS